MLSVSFSWDRPAKHIKMFLIFLSLSVAIIAQNGSGCL